MEIFGLSITRRKASLSQIPDSNRGWISLIRESFPGAWQRNITVDRSLVTSNPTVFACMTRIASDIAKLGSPRFKRLKKEIWEVGSSSAYDPVLRKPNQFQTPNQFWSNWVLSKLTHGNAYILKARDARNVVTRMWVLDPNLVQVLVSDSGDVFYQLQQDNLVGVRSTLQFPASEIIHDRMNSAFFHPLVGLSPIYAAGLVATQGLNIIGNSASFFSNSSIPGGIITSPHTIPDATAERIKRDWDSRYGPNGSSPGGTAVMGDGLEFKSMAMTATDAQMLEQLKWSAEQICSCFSVPPYKVGVGAPPSYNNIEALNLEYYSQAIQPQLEDIEACLLDGLDMKSGTKVEFDQEGMHRMDTLTKANAVNVLRTAGVLAPNEGRAKFDLAPVSGGETPYLQQQNFSLAALAKRDAQEDPFGTAAPPQSPEPTEEPEEAEEETNNDEQERRYWAFTKGLYSDQPAA